MFQAWLAGEMKIPMASHTADHCVILVAFLCLFAGEKELSNLSRISWKQIQREIAAVAKCVLVDPAVWLSLLRLPTSLRPLLVASLACCAALLRHLQSCSICALSTTDSCC
jgi:hypothetical protein